MRNLVIPLMLLACVGAIGKEEVSGGGKVTITKEIFGKSPEGKDVELYTLTNASGMKAKIMTFGALLTSLEVPDKTGKPGQVVLGFDTLQEYLAGHPFFGATTGRYANRIAKGQFTLDGKVYTLAKNNGENHLHGGVRGFDKVLWRAKEVDGGVSFIYLSPDGEEGYPGNLTAVVTYYLTDKNELRLEYSATTDKTTVLNLTHHTYFNLGGPASGNILDHELTIYGDQFVPVDAGGIPTGGTQSVKGTPMDFTSAHKIGARIADVGGNPSGYDHTWVLNNKTPGKLSTCARLADARSGRVMEIFTTEPGVQFYTGNYLDGKVKARGVVCNKHQALCLETQHFPDSPNHPEFPSTVLQPGETYRQTTVHRFSAK